MPEDRTKADFIKGTFAVRADRLRAKGPRGDGTIPLPQWNALYGILWETCEYFLALSGASPEARFPDYSEATGILAGLTVGDDDRVWVTGLQILPARRRKLMWLRNRYVESFGPMPGSYKTLLRGPVSPTELRAAIMETWDSHPVRGIFQGRIDDARTLDFEAV
jgi:hypothetical protein